MRVRARTSKISDADRLMIGGSLVRGRMGARVGAEHLVLGLVFSFASPRLGSGVWVIYQDQGGNGVMLPMTLFELIDPRASRHWVFHRADEHSVALWPPSFTKDYFFDDASNRGTSARSELNAIQKLLEEEEELSRQEGGESGR